MNSEYDSAFIFPYLEKTQYCSLTTKTDQGINARFMVFACNKDLDRFYLLTHNSTEKVGHIKNYPEVNLSLLKTAEDMGDSIEVSAKGLATILNEFDNDFVQEGFKLLKEKNPMIEMLYKGGSMGDYVMLKIDTKELVFRVYKEILQNVPKTILRF